MLFTVRVVAHGNEPEEYEADDIYDVIDQLLEEWVNGDADLPGALAFLKAEGYDFGVADEEVDEGTDEDLLENAANAIRTILHIGVDDSEIDDAAAALEKLANFLAAIGDEYQITEGCEDEDDEDADQEADPDAIKDVEQEAKDVSAEPDQQKIEANADDGGEIDEDFEKALDEDYDY